MDKLNQGEEVLSVIDVSKEEYEKALKELENFINPIMSNVVQEGGGEFMNERTMPHPPSEPPQYNPPSEPPIEEID